ncbi:MAG: ATP-grasp domain-containing protein [Desulfobacterales bacterium]|nr:ATP-grasp domain-containing protein [Desulfobacterales bacterium]
MTMTSVIWFNKCFSSIYDIIEQIKESDTKKEFKILCTHENPEFIGFEKADLHEVEKTNMGNEDYINYCLNICRLYNVSLFLPFKKASFIASQMHRFEEAGIKVLVCASPEIFEILNDKVRLYDTLKDCPVLIPEYYKFNSLDSFKSAYQILKKNHKKICLKPTQSVYGLGFKIIKEDINDLKSFLSGDINYTTLDDLTQKLSMSNTFRDMMLMEYLDGTEYSIDCLAKDGNLICATVRKKPFLSGRAQILVKNEQLIETAKFLTQKFQLNYIFNIQMRGEENSPKLLEINSRMAGGLYFSTFSGINYTYWAIKLAMGSDISEIPKQEYNIRVNQAYKSFQLKDR